MSNVPMYRNTNNIAFGVSVLIVLESLFTLLYRDNGPEEAREVREQRHGQLQEDHAQDPGRVQLV